MNLRPTQSTSYQQVLRGISANTQRLVAAQEQTATGKRILRPSDDPVGAATAISLRRKSSNLDSFLASVEKARPIISTAAVEIEQASSLMSEGRALVLQGLNGSLSQEDRNSVADQIEEVAEALMGVGNARFGDRYLFAGTETGTRPFGTTGSGPDRFVSYQGNSEEQDIRIGRDTSVGLNLPGDELFSGAGYTKTSYAGMTGITSGATVDQGTGFTRLELRTDSVAGFTNGVALAATGTPTVLGDHTLAFSATNNTVSLDGGPNIQIATPLPTALKVKNDDGAVVTLDLTGWDGADSSMTITGEGSISADGVNFQAINRTETDLELVLDGIGVVHVNTTGLKRSGEEAVTFKGATNSFDALFGIIKDLREGDVLGLEDMRGRVEMRYDELVNHQDQTLVALGRLGARGRRLNDTQTRLDESSIQVIDLISRNEDVDLTEVALELNRTEQTLQIAMASGARLLQQTLLNFI
ncbi:MAG: flagellar hook-associated protein 3 FlgL [Planctomycetota bacterium]|jgi:flagellar hook-associated protein 3 FlgL